MTPQGNADILTEAQLLLIDCHERAPAIAEYDISQITLQINPRLRSTIGRAWTASGRIEINPTTWVLNTEHRLEIMAHEYAHIVARRRFQSRGHDLGWRAVMRSLGFDPRRGIPSAHGTVHNTRTVYCACGDKQIGVIRYNRIVNNTAAYHCALCRQTVTTGEDAS